MEGVAEGVDGQMDTLSEQSSLHSSQPALPALPSFPAPNTPPGDPQLLAVLCPHRPEGPWGQPFQ